MVDRTGSVEDVGALKEVLIKELRELEAVRTTPVEDAIRAVDRHHFVPEARREDAYAAEHAEVTKRDTRGVALSSISAARIQAFMLEQADIQPGMRVLEIGSGGLNAAMIARLVGDTGEVTSIDIDMDVIERADHLLSTGGFERVRVAVADGDNGYPPNAPYDRILVTVEAADLPETWMRQLAPDGRIVVPLRVRGQTRSVAFQRLDDRLVADSYELCGFVPMRGSSARSERLVVLRKGDDDHVGLRWDDDQQLDRERLAAAFTSPRTQAWSELTMVPPGAFDDLDLWLATTQPRYALLATTKAARDRALVTSWSPMGVSALVHDSGDSFAYLTFRPTTAERTEFVFGAVGHGPHAEEIADEMAHLMTIWDQAVRGTHADFQAFPVSRPDADLPAGYRQAGPAFRLVISWPGTRDV